MYRQFMRWFLNPLVEIMTSKNNINQKEDEQFCERCHKKASSNVTKHSIVCKDCYKIHGGSTPEQDKISYDWKENCYICQKNFSEVGEQYQLLDKVTYLCAECFNVYSREQGLNEIKNNETMGVEKSVFEQKVTKQQDENVHKIVICCPSCNKNFEHEVDLQEAKNTKLNEVIEVRAFCTYCGQSFSGSIQKQTSS